MQTTARAWQCEYPECGRVWLAKTESAPRLCAGCKRTGWHKTATIQETIRLANWREQLIEEVKPYILDQIKIGIDQAILDAKRRRTETTGQALPPRPGPEMAVASSLPSDKCGKRREDYETGHAGYCGRMAGHLQACGNWIKGEPLDP